MPAWRSAFGLDPQARACVFEEWRNSIKALAQRRNVCCKIGGFGLPFWGFGFDAREEPIGFEELAATSPVLTVVEAFGCNRCMMESNYPPDGRSAGFVPLWNALKHVLRSASQEEKEALFQGAAARTYRLSWSNNEGIERE